MNVENILSGLKTPSEDDNYDIGVYNKNLKILKDAILKLEADKIEASDTLNLDENGAVWNSSIIQKYVVKEIEKKVEEIFENRVINPTTNINNRLLGSEIIGKLGTDSFTGFKRYDFEDVIDIDNTEGNWVKYFNEIERLTGAFLVTQFNSDSIKVQYAVNTTKDYTLYYRVCNASSWGDWINVNTNKFCEISRGTKVNLLGAEIYNEGTNINIRTLENSININKVDVTNMTSFSGDIIAQTITYDNIKLEHFPTNNNVFTAKLELNKSSGKEEYEVLMSVARISNFPFFGSQREAWPSIIDGVSTDDKEVTVYVYWNGEGEIPKINMTLTTFFKKPIN